MLYNLSDYFSIRLNEIPPNTDLQNMKEGFKAIIYCFPDSYYREEDYGKKVFPTYIAKKINNEYQYIFIIPKSNIIGFILFLCLTNQIVNRII